MIKFIKSWFKNPVIFKAGDWFEYNEKDRPDFETHFVKLLNDIRKKDRFDWPLYVRSFNEDGQITSPIIYKYAIENSYKKTDLKTQNKLEKAYKNKMQTLEQQEEKWARESKENAMNNFLKINSVEQPIQPLRKN